MTEKIRVKNNFRVVFVYYVSRPMDTRITLKRLICNLMKKLMPLLGMMLYNPPLTTVGTRLLASILGVGFVNL